MSAHIARIRSTLAALAVILVATLAIPVTATAAGPTVIGVDGTTVPLPINLTDSVLNFNQGEYLNQPGYNVIMSDYPRSFGILTLGGPNYDDSVASGVAGASSYIKLAQDGDSSVPVKLVCLSQGSDVCTQTNDQLQAAGYDQSGVTYVLLGNVRNADGGLKTRIPYIGDKGIFVPGPGVTLGNATPTAGSDATIIQVSYEYDGFARAPRYPINLLADINAAAGSALEHGNYRNADPYAPDNIVSTTSDGKITNIVIPVNEVPLLTVARAVGLPKPVAEVVNPTLKAVIDTGYDPIPEGTGAYPTEAKPFKILPSEKKFREDVANVRTGVRESGKKFREALESLAPKQSNPKKRPKLDRQVRSTLSDVRRAIRNTVDNIAKTTRPRTTDSGDKGDDNDKPSSSTNNGQDQS